MQSLRNLFQNGLPINIGGRGRRAPHPHPERVLHHQGQTPQGPLQGHAAQVRPARRTPSEREASPPVGRQQTKSPRRSTPSSSPDRPIEHRPSPSCDFPFLLYICTLSPRRPKWTITKLSFILKSMQQQRQLLLPPAPRKSANGLNFNQLLQYPAQPPPALPSTSNTPTHTSHTTSTDLGLGVPPRSPFGDKNSNFKVVVRVRPPLDNEIDPMVPFQSIIRVAPDFRSLAIMEYLGAEVREPERQQDIYQNPHLIQRHTFPFDRVYDLNSSQAEVYAHTAQPAVLSSLEGYNATLLAYGQTGTGKTHTMEGFSYQPGDPQRGIVPRAMEEIFRFIQTKSAPRSTFMVRTSYLQIYNDVISDLLKADRTALQIREDRRRGLFVQGLSEWAVRSPGEIFSLMQRGAQSRAIAPTKMNPDSSRSHAVFMIIVEQMTVEEDEAGGEEASVKRIKVGKLNLVDLAGSERVRVTGATGKRLEESKSINQTLSSLGNVIAALTETKVRRHIPYRDSKLTRILQDSLGGNCITTMMAMISPTHEAFAESISTLKFATRAKKIKNEPKINEDVDQRALLRQYEVELRRLKDMLARKTESIVNNERMLQLEDEKKRAEEDKVAAITALEARSAEFEQQKHEKKQLEEKIKFLGSQLLIGGKKIEDLPQFRSALAQQQKLIRSEYQEKLADIEKERQMIEEDKAQVDRYKQLLLKQRDIMIALTARVNERDMSIISLQEELDAYEKVFQETEEAYASEHSRVQELERFIRAHRLVPPQASAREGGGGDGLPSLRKYAPEREEGPGMPMHLLTAEEKIEELTHIVEDLQGAAKERERRGAGGQVEQERAAAEAKLGALEYQAQEMLVFLNKDLGSALARLQQELAAPNQFTLQNLSAQSHFIRQMVGRAAGAFARGAEVLGGEEPRSREERRGGGLEERGGQRQEQFETSRFGGVVRGGGGGGGLGEVDLVPKTRKEQMVMEMLRQRKVEKRLK